MKLTQDIIRNLIKEQLQEQMDGSEREEKVQALMQQIYQLPKEEAMKVADGLRAAVAKLPDDSQPAPGEENIELQVKEKLDKDATAGEYVKDFRTSDAPQFKGKSKKKKQKMAIAAYLDAKEN
jgi:hypothetical protein